MIVGGMILHKLYMFFIFLISFPLFSDNDDGMVIVDSYKIVASKEQSGAYLLTVNYKVEPYRQVNGSFKYELDIDIYDGFAKIAEVDNIYRTGVAGVSDSVTVSFYPRDGRKINPKSITIKVEVDDVRPLSRSTQSSAANLS